MKVYTMLMIETAFHHETTQTAMLLRELLSQMTNSLEMTHEQ